MRYAQHCECCFCESRRHNHGNGERQFTDTVAVRGERGLRREQVGLRVGTGDVGLLVDLEAEARPQLPRLCEVVPGVASRPGGLLPARPLPGRRCRFAAFASTRILAGAARRRLAQVSCRVQADDVDVHAGQRIGFECTVVEREHHRRRAVLRADRQRLLHVEYRQRVGQVELALQRRRAG